MRNPLMLLLFDMKYHLQTKLDAVMKKNPRYKEKLLSTNEPQAHLSGDPNGLPQIHAPNNQRKPIIPAGEKGIVKITNIL